MSFKRLEGKLLKIKQFQTENSREIINIFVGSKSLSFGLNSSGKVASVLIRESTPYKLLQIFVEVLQN